MKTMHEFVELLTGQGIVDALVTQVLDQDADFQQTYCGYLTAVNKLRTELGDHAVDEAVSAIHKQAASDLFFAGALGLKMNLDHFTNPLSPNCTWSCVDYDDFLREDISHSLPQYQRAKAVLSDFYSLLTQEQQELYSAIAEYESLLATVGPKLAHYYGYLLGNELLHRVMPGYRSDMGLTIKYNAMLENYFGKHFLPTEV